MATSEQEMVEGLDSEGLVAYKQWHYTAEQLLKVLASYASLGTTTTAPTALERAIAELTKLLTTERFKWERFVDKCIALNINPNLANDRLINQHETARHRLMSFDQQYADALQCGNSGNNSTPRVPVKMPPIHLPTFDGKRENWTNFWVLFKDLIHDKGELTYSHKFTYLQQCCVGDAKELITGFIPDQAGYDNAVKILKEQYDETHLLQHQMQSKLLTIKSPSNNLEELKSFRLAYQKVIRTLDSLSLINSKELIKTILFNKLHIQTTKKMVEVLGINFNYDAFDAQLLKMTQQMEFCRSQEERQEKPKKQINVNAAVLPSPPQVRGCNFCDEQHPAFKCPTYVTVSQRREKLKERYRCLRCGRSGHFARDCYSKLSCYKCQGEHWAALCPKPTNNQSSSKPITSIQTTVDGARKQPNSTVQRTTTPITMAKPTVEKKKDTTPKTKGNTPTTQVNKCQVGRNDQKGGVALPTAMLNVHAPYINENQRQETRRPVRAFFDSGSQCSFIHPDLVDQLKLRKSKPKEVSVIAFGGDVQNIQCTTVRVKISMGKGPIHKINLIVTDKVDMRLVVPGLHETATRLKNKGVKLADEYGSDVIDQVQVMIGADHFDRFITGLKRTHQVNLFTSKAGHLISGRVYGSSSYNPPEAQYNNQLFVVARVTMNETDYLTCDVIPKEEPDIATLWELETVGINAKREMLTAIETNVLEEFAENITKVGNKYEVSLPWKHDPISLPTNYGMAKGQLSSLITKLQKDPRKYGYYKDILESYLEQDFIEEVTDEKIHGHYLPFHGVVKESATTPIRLVFNASSKANEQVPSLNDLLETGPNLTERLVDCLLSFRTKRYAVTADINKAFLRVGMAPLDRDYLRFLWVEDLNQPDEIKTYRFRVVPFGSTCSPFLLQGTLYKHFSNINSEYKETLLKSFYVDNFMTTMDDESQLYKLYHETIRYLLEAGMPLQMWNSNNKEFNQYINDESREEVTKVLGLKWNTSEDSLSLNEVKLGKRECVTKRQCLSDLSSLYDPVGLFAPITFLGKILMRDIWREKVGWDERLPEVFKDRLNEIIEVYNQLHTVSLPRRCIEDNDDLYVFCDASGEGYGCVAYSISPTSSKLIMSRSRVAPMSTRSIVQLELTALLLGCRLVQYLVTEIHRFNNVIIWSDNQCCITWMSECKIKDVYVKNRVAEAKRLIEAFDIKVKYVSTKQNPADILSRGADLEALMSSNWFKDSELMFTLAQSQCCKLETIPCNLETVPYYMEKVDMSDEKLTIGNEEFRCGVKCERNEEGVGDSLEPSRVTQEENGDDSGESQIENGDPHSEPDPGNELSNANVITTKSESDSSLVIKSCALGDTYELSNQCSVTLPLDDKDIVHAENKVESCSCNQVLVNEHEALVVQELLTEIYFTHNVETILPIREYTNLDKLYRITNSVFRCLNSWYKRALKDNAKEKCIFPSAEKYYLLAAQRQEYPLVIECLTNKRTQEQFAGARKFIKDLSLVLDDEGLLRSMGRLGNAEESQIADSPLILPSKSWLCHLIVLRTHERCLHGGTADTLAHIRRKFWIPKGRQTVKNVTSKCVICRHYNGRPFVYPSPPPLPRERVTLDKPFKYTAVDFTGAIPVFDPNTGNMCKEYICLFSCLATRAVFLETIDSLSAEKFILCLKRFFARCSVPAKMYSDNGTNFTAVQKLIEEIKYSSEVKQLLNEKCLAWQFNVPGAPWQGGNFERLIKIVKSTLHKALHGRKVTSQELRTFLAEVEATVNSRPLTYVSSERDHDDILTPAKLLYGRDIDLYPNSVVEKKDEYKDLSNTDVLIDYHNRLSKIYVKFKKLWESDYLASLREKHDYQLTQPDRVPKKGEIVLVNVPGEKKLPLAKIVEVRPGKDGLVREVSVFKEGKLSRVTINKLIPLEISQQEVDQCDLPAVQERCHRPKRLASMKADAERLHLIDEDQL